MNRNIELPGEDGKLVAGGGAINVYRDELWLFAFFGEELGEFAGGGGFAGALEADDHDDGGRFIRETELGLVSSEQPDELILDDFYDLLGGGKSLEDLFALGLFPNVFNEFLDDFEVDVSFEQSDADLLQGRIHVGLGEFSFSAQVFEDSLELIA